MNHPADHTADSTAEARQDEEYAMPCAEAMLASALALMTGYVQGCCDDHRALMAQKIVHHLVTLSQHPMLSPDFKAMLWNLHSRWLQQAQQGLASAAQLLPQDMQRALWHSTHEVVQ